MCMRGSNTDASVPSADLYPWHTLADLQARTGAYTEKAAIVGLAAGIVVLVLWSSGMVGTERNSGP